MTYETLLHYHGGPETANWPEILQQKPISTHKAQFIAMQPVRTKHYDKNVNKVLWQKINN